ncbi:uncharacterized protein LOC119381877 [Rhipicephalus sanguineus]|uniref:uncharacterized protein LOC119381877 n=1 Tax=Rhipicephalus sanguineus TaxID=34632 RepID=UPI001892FECB|nr:uncharacterized protein LOC119381877 [Rhipicephalus sanguineus]
MAVSSARQPTLHQCGYRSRGYKSQEDDKDLPVHYLDDKRTSPRKSHVWRTRDRRPLCFHCGEADHLYRQCPYRRMGLRGFSAYSPPPRYGQRPRDFENYLAQQRMPPPTRRQSRSPSPRRFSPPPQRYAGARSPSPRRAN